MTTISPIMPMPNGKHEIRTCPNSGERALHAVRDFAEGDIVAAFGARAVRSRPDYLTVQIDEDTHILLAPERLQYINHSCDPNVVFEIGDVARKDGLVIALRPIRAGEEFTFFYPSTEWAMDRPFACRCGSAQCLGEIRGASQLPTHRLKDYRLSRHVERSLHRKRREDAVAGERSQELRMTA